MTNTTFYYTDGSHRVLKTSNPIQYDVLTTLAHDFRATTYRPRRDDVKPLTQREIDVAKSAVKTAKYGHKAFKKTGLYRANRDSLIKDLVGHHKPNWSGVRLIITANGL